jgi:hypothetical protein
MQIKLTTLITTNSSKPTSFLQVFEIIGTSSSLIVILCLK